MLIAQNSRGVWAQRVHGAEKADTGMLPLPAKGAPNAGAPFWSNTFAVFDKAKQPQAYTDFLIWLLGPANKDVHQAIVESGKCPVPRSIYPAMVDTKPQYKWMALHRDMVAASVPYPENSFWALQNTKVLPWITKLMEKDTKLTPQEAMANAVKEIKEEVAKQKVR
jgi:ABC-type glycerol-3-phosphate transport system substrate-binding protein